MHPGATKAVLKLPKPQTDNTKTCLHVTETTKTTRPMSTRYRDIRKNFDGPKHQLDCRRACRDGRNRHKTTAAPTTSSAPIANSALTTSKQTTNKKTQGAPAGPLSGMVSRKKNTGDNILQIYTPQLVFTQQPKHVNKGNPRWYCNRKSPNTLPLPAIKRQNCYRNKPKQPRLSWQPPASLPAIIP